MQQDLFYISLMKAAFSFHFPFRMLPACEKQVILYKFQPPVLEIGIYLFYVPLHMNLAFHFHARTMYVCMYVHIYVYVDVFFDV